MGKSEASLSPDIPHDGLRLTILQRALLRPTPTLPTVAVLRIKTSNLTNLVPLHRLWNFSPHQVESVTDVLHRFRISQRVLLSLNLRALACASEEFRLVLKGFRSPFPFPSPLGRVWSFGRLPDFPLPALARHRVNFWSSQKVKLS